MLIFKVLKKIYTKLFGYSNREKPQSIQNADKASKLIYEALMSDKPCMIARFGSTELTCLTNYLGVHSSKKEVLKYIKGEGNPWWWEKSILNQMQQWSGFFPPSIEKIEEFCELMLEDMKSVDILGSWLSQEKEFEEQISKAQKVRLVYLEPFWTSTPWTKALKGKKVLVIHPFTETIKEQYLKKDLIFPNGLLPEFELKTIQAVQSLGGLNTEFSDWFEALNSMKQQIDEIDFDICIIGAGAYGFPLAAHVKRMGKKAFHLGGSSQLLFGIKGKRWETKDYGKALNLDYPSMFNKYWIKPGAQEKPKTSDQVEDNCYW